MAPGFPIKVNNIKISNVECLYQACRFPDNPALQKAIISESNPKASKDLTLPYRDQTRSDWNKVRLKIMRWCLRVKLVQNWEPFSALLLATGNLPIVEESWKDDFWGAKPINESNLVGKNALGRLLMELREEIKNNAVELSQQVEPLNIPNFKLCSIDIDVIKASDSIGQQQLIS